MNEIIVISHSPDEYTNKCVESILNTAAVPYVLRILKVKQSAAPNKNLAIHSAISDQFILVNDDIYFEQKNWNLILFETLNSKPNIAVVGCRIDLPKGSKYITMSARAPRNCLIDNIRIPDCVLAIKKTEIRFDENYITSQGDDIDYMLQLINKKYNVLVDTRVSAYHMKIPCQIDKQILQKNYQYALRKWGERYDKWGNDLSKIVIVKEYK